MSASSPLPSDIAVRLNYHDGMFLTAQNMTLEQNYFSNWIKLQNQYLYTPGVLNGLLVTLQNNILTVEAGVAFDASGDFLVFPGASGNAIGAASNLGNRYGLYLCYPPLVKSSADVYDSAAILQNAALNLPPENSVILATVDLDPSGNGTIASVTDSRIAVTSRLPAVLSSTATGQLSAMPDLDGVRYGTVTVDTTALLKPTDSATVQVSYAADAEVAPAFTSPPFVSVTVLGTSALAASVGAVGPTEFSLTVTALQTRTDGVLQVQVNWLALPSAAPVGARVRA